MVDQLSSIDASFLHLETAETPMHTGGLMLVEMPEGYDGDYYEDVKSLFAERLHMSPVLHRKLATMPFELSEPVWIEDDDVELDYHVRHATLRTGKFEELELLVARLHASLMDRSRPLWEVYVIDGLESGQVGIYQKTHHAGVDGKGSVELAKVLYDDEPTGRKIPAPRRRRGKERYQLGVSEMLEASATNALSQYRKIAELIPTAGKAMFAAAKVTNSQRTPRGERNLILGTAPRTIFNDTITNQRSYTTMSTDLGEIKALGRRVGGTVNTIVMATCSIALERFLDERGLLPKEPLIAMVPVSLRTEGDNSANNQVSSVRVDLATDIKDLPERFKAIHNSSEAAKAVVRELRPVLGVEVPMTGAPWMMTGMAQMIGRLNVKRLPAAGNVLISNVPGMPTRMYFAGATIIHTFPVSIPYHASALNITVVSYNGQLEWGITADRRILSQDESHEVIQLMKDAIHDIGELPSVAAAG
ncbi:MAG TPA: wax ester/triacylglycerol synthase family O-acyltransferase [Nocardioides sp.]|nr:wax ester/triacylglycerol synthase family O-acyltransferase [Nocardioides sp.]